MRKRMNGMVAAGAACAERCLKLITPYDELSAAEQSGDMLAMESILARLVREWQAVGGLVCIPCLLCLEENSSEALYRTFMR